MDFATGSSDIHESVSRIFFLSKLVFLFPLRLNDIHLSFSYCKLFLSCIVVLTLGTANLIISVVQEGIYYSDYSSFLEFIVALCVIMVAGMLPTLALLLVSFKWRLLQEVLIVLDSVDASFRRVGMTRQLKGKNYRLARYALSFLAAVVVDTHMTLSGKALSNFIGYMYYYVTRIYILIIVDQMCSFFDLICSRFRSMCRYVRLKSSYTRSRRMDWLVTAVDANERLVFIYGQLNSFYSVHLLMLMTFTLSTFILDLFATRQLIVNNAFSSFNSRVARNFVSKVIMYSPCWDILASLSMITYKTMHKRVVGTGTGKTSMSIKVPTTRTLSFPLTLQKEFVAEILDAILLPSRLAGVFPARTDGPAVSVSFPGLLLSITVCAGYLSAFVLSAVYALDLPEASYVTTAVNYIIAFLVSCLPTIAVINLLSSLGKLSTALWTLRDAGLLIALHVKRTAFSYRMKYIYVEGVVLIGTLVTGYYELSAKGMNGTVTILQMWLFTFLLAHLMILANQYSNLTSLVGDLFDFCNMELRSTSSNDAHRTRYTIAQKSLRLEALCQLYGRLCDAAKVLHEIQVPHVLLIIMSSFILFVSEAYDGMVVLFSPGSTVANLQTIFLKISWTLGVGIPVYQIATACEYCANKAEEFNTLLYQIMIDDKTNEISSNNKLKLHIMMKRQIVFTACGFFTLDYRLAGSMVVSATTYLVILIQFGQQEDPALLTPTAIYNGSTTS